MKRVWQFHKEEAEEKIEEDIYTNVKKNFYRELEFFWDKIFDRIKKTLMSFLDAQVP